MWLIKIRGEPGLPLKDLDLLLGVLQRLLSRKYWVIHPLFKLLACFIEVLVVGFQRLADGRFCVTLRRGQAPAVARTVTRSTTCPPKNSVHNCRSR
jgi:hypothetical protein